MADQPRVYVVDDDTAVLASARALLEPQGYEVLVFTSADAFLEHATLDQPGCVITDILMPDVDGVELQQRLLTAGSTLSLIVVTGVATVATTVKLMQRGAMTILEKPYEQSELRRAVEAALLTSQHRWRQLQDNRATLARLDSLTAEEQQVMQLMVAGKANKAIAAMLGLSSRTLDRRRQAVLTKLNVESTAELVSLIRTLTNQDVAVRYLAGGE